jgi:hypothetical protein
MVGDGLHMNMLWIGSAIGVLEMVIVAIAMVLWLDFRRAARRAQAVRFLRKLQWALDEARMEEGAAGQVRGGRRSDRGWRSRVA